MFWMYTIDAYQYDPFHLFLNCTTLISQSLEGMMSECAGLNRPVPWEINSVYMCPSLAFSCLTGIYCAELRNT